MKLATDRDIWRMQCKQRVKIMLWIGFGLVLVLINF